MSAKSRRKRSLHGKKKKMKLRQPVAYQPPPAAVPAEVPVRAQVPISPLEVPVSEKRRPASPRPVTDKYSYIFTELRRIGILGGVMLVILIALALILT